MQYWTDSKALKKSSRCMMPMRNKVLYLRLNDVGERESSVITRIWLFCLPFESTKYKCMMFRFIVLPHLLLEFESNMQYLRYEWVTEWCIVQDPARSSQKYVLVVCKMDSNRRSIRKIDTYVSRIQITDSKNTCKISPKACDASVGKIGHSWPAMPVA